MTRPDVIVVGLGAMGSAALFQLAERGVRALGIDRFAPPHEEGSSHGETRITRQAIGEGPSYVPLVMRSHELWREIEARTGESLFEASGLLVLSTGGAGHPRKPTFLDTTIAAARDFGIPHEIWSPAEITARFPQFGIDGDERGYYEPGAGILHPERCIAAQLQLGREGGAAIRTGEVVTAVAPSGSGVRVETDRGTYDAGAAIVTVGGWAPGLLGPVAEPLSVHRQVLHWFAPERPADYAPDRFPAFIWLQRQAAGHVYGFPTLPGTEGVKVATESFSEPLGTPEAMDRDVAPDESRAFYDAFVAGRLAGLSARVIKAKTCLYTVAPDSDFLIDAHPASSRIQLVSACSGHGFKHSAAIGEALAEIVLDGRARIDLTPFSFSRFAAARRGNASFTTAD